MERKPRDEKGSKETPASQNVDNAEKTVFKKYGLDETVGNNTDWVFDDIKG